jgi:acetyl-CoA C-acetyltransferase
MRGESLRDVSIIGVGQTPVAEHWETSLRHLAYTATQAALQDAGGLAGVDALYVGNMLGGQLSHQEHLGALIADFVGMRGIEALGVEAADASGGAALRAAYLAVGSGAVETAMVLGVEKFTDVVGSARLAAIATTLDADYEGAQGATPTALAALLMRRYMHEYGIELGQFAGFSINAHFNASLNANAMYRNRLRPGAFEAAPPVATPVGLFDAAPEGDGAAALILTGAERAKDMVPRPVRISASSVATDTLSVHDRPDPLALSAANVSAGRAYDQAEVTPADVDVFELHDAFTILAALTLEACGFAARGEGVGLADEAGIGLKGRIPVSTFGGLKARGHAGGATGVYQAAEVTLQLRGQAGDNQVPDAKIGMAQNLGGIGGTAITHIFEVAD